MTALKHTSDTELKLIEPAHSLTRRKTRWELLTDARQCTNATTQNKSVIGKPDEILGMIDAVYLSWKWEGA